jgi:hypothetical protein
MTQSGAPSDRDLFLADTGDFLRAYLAGDELTRRNLVVYMHFRLRDTADELQRVKVAAAIITMLLVACLIGIIAATH